MMLFDLSSESFSCSCYFLEVLFNVRVAKSNTSVSHKNCALKELKKQVIFQHECRTADD